jgi:drug/metabolite transporter (DMT)-like permease
VVCGSDCFWWSHRAGVADAWLNQYAGFGASLLLNAEGVFTALLAWFAFKENFDHRIALGMLAIVAGR